MVNFRGLIVFIAVVFLSASNITNGFCSYWGYPGDNSRSSFHLSITTDHEDEQSRSEIVRFTSSVASFAASEKFKIENLYIRAEDNDCTFSDDFPEISKVRPEKLKQATWPFMAFVSDGQSVDEAGNFIIKGDLFLYGRASTVTFSDCDGFYSNKVGLKGTAAKSALNISCYSEAIDLSSVFNNKIFRSVRLHFAFNGDGDFLS